MSISKPSITFSRSLLKDFLTAALTNSELLFEESTYLLLETHYARAYFLAVASIEETGKAALAFNALGRRLENSAVQSRLNVEFNDHSAKITAAFIAMLKRLSKAALRENFQTYLNLQVSLKHGREASMYVGINESNTVHTPKGVVRPNAAADCVRLARDCLGQTKMMVSSEPPNTFTHYQDRMFALGKKASRVLNSANFGTYLFYVIENEGFDSDSFARAICTYYDEYLSKGSEFVLQPS